MVVRRLIETYQESFRGVPKPVWLIATVLLVARCGTMVLPFLSIYFATELGFEPVKIGWLLGTYGAGGVIGSWLGGQMTQWIGAVRTMLLSLTLTIPGYLILEQVDSFYTAALSLLYLSVAAECFRPASITATINFCKHEDQHTKSLAVNRLAVNLGMTVGPAVGGFLATVNYSWLFYANAFGALLALICVFGFFGIPKNPITKKPTEAEKAAASPWRDRQFLMFLAISTSVAVIFFQLLGTFPLYLKEHYHLDEDRIGLLFAVNTIVIVLFEMILVNFIRPFRKLRVIAVGQFLSCIGFGLLPLAVGAPFWVGQAFCVFTVLIWTIGEMLSLPLEGAYVAGRSNIHNRGDYMGIYVMSFSVSSILAPIIGMRIYQWNPHVLWFFALIVGGLAFVAMIWLSRFEERSVVTSEDSVAVE